MKKMTLKTHLISLVKNKAKQSDCFYKVAALGLNKKGEVVSTATNSHRFCRKGGSVHAEMRLLKRHPKSLKTIIICRIGKKGDILPIHPCSVCSDKANELGVRILTIN